MIWGNCDSNFVILVLRQTAAFWKEEMGYSRFRKLDQADFNDKFRKNRQIDSRYDSNIF
jgi:hypothetical protein